MNLRQELIVPLKREEQICESALKHLQEKCLEFEKKYKMSTKDFLEKFNQGLLGDSQDFFKWFALAEGMKEWAKTKEALEETLK
jgi:hypothetical protein